MTVNGNPISYGAASSVTGFLNTALIHDNSQSSTLVIKVSEDTVGKITRY